MSRFSTQFNFLMFTFPSFIHSLDHPGMSHPSLSLSLSLYMQWRWLGFCISSRKRRKRNRYPAVVAYLIPFLKFVDDVPRLFFFSFLLSASRHVIFFLTIFDRKESNDILHIYIIYIYIYFFFKWKERMCALQSARDASMISSHSSSMYL